LQVLSSRSSSIDSEVARPFVAWVLPNLSYVYHWNRFCLSSGKKVELLYADATEAVMKIRSAFRPGIIDLEKTTVNCMLAAIVSSINLLASAITLPEVFDGLEFELPMLKSMYFALFVSLFVDSFFSDFPELEDGLITLNIAHVKDITFANEIDIMRHTQGSASFDLLSPEKFVADKFVTDQVCVDLVALFLRLICRIC
jgi:hypothetical protein